MIGECEIKILATMIAWFCMGFLISELRHSKKSKPAGESK